MKAAAKFALLNHFQEMPDLSQVHPGATPNKELQR